MNFNNAKEMAQLGANIIFEVTTGIQAKDALEIVKIVVANGGNVTIEKKYHPTDIKKMIEVGKSNITIKI